MKKRTMKKTKILLSFYLLILAILLVDCDRKSNMQNEFNPTMITKLDLSNTKSIIVEEYFKNKKICSEKVVFEYKSKIDTAFTEFKEAKYSFRLKKNFHMGMTIN